MLRVSPAISTQLAPAPLQRFHWNEYEVGLSVQVPVAAVRVWPSSAVPEIVGGAVFVGAASAGAGAPRTTVAARTAGRSSLDRRPV